MKLDSELVIGLSTGQQQRIVEAGDVQITIPSVITPTVPTSLPIQYASSGTVRQTYSAIVDSNINRVNQAAIQTDILTIGPGYWDITIAMTCWFNWLHLVATAPDVVVYAIVGGRDIFLVSMYAVVGTQKISETFRFLTRDEMIFTHEVGLTGAAANSDTIVCISANKIL